MTDEIYQRCLEYRSLYVFRFSQGTISAKTLKSFHFFAKLFGAPEVENVPQHKGCHLILPEYCNLVNFLQEVSKIEEEIGYMLWRSYFISSDDLYGRDMECKRMFNVTVTTILEKLFKTVVRRDWLAAGLIIESIPIYPSKLTHEKLYHRTAVKAFSLYFLNFYLTSLQILLESKKSIDAISQRYFYAFDQFMRIHLFKHVSFDNSEFYAVHFLIFQLGHLLFSSADSVSGFNLVKRNTEWTRCLIVYKYLVDYEKFISKQLEVRRQKTSSGHVGVSVIDFNEIMPGGRLFSFFSTALSSLIHNPTSLNGRTEDCIGLMPVFIHLAKVLGKTDELEQCLEDICLSCLLLLERVYEVLSRFELDHIAGRIFSKAIVLLPPETLANHDFIIEIIEQRSLEPSSFGPLCDVILLNLRCLFNFLDFGRNRCNERAWPLLHANLRYIETELRTFVEPLWQPRQSWWRKFHFSIKLNGVARKTRKLVFKILEETTEAMNF